MKKSVLNLNVHTGENKGYCLYFMLLPKNDHKDNKYNKFRELVKITKHLQCLILETLQVFFLLGIEISKLLDTINKVIKTAIFDLFFYK